MVKKDMGCAGDFEGIKNLTREAVDTMLGLKLDTLVSTYRAVKRQKTLQIHSIRCSALKRKSVTVQYFQEQALS